MNQIPLADYRRQIQTAIDDGRYEEAMAHSRHIFEHYPKCLEAYWLLGQAMAEANQNDHATDMLQRVLSADPEHIPAWIAMSDIARKRNNLEDAVWYLQRAFELATDNEMVANKLRHLYGELEGTEPERLQLTQGALAKLYLRANLLTRAITELRRLIEEYPDRLDLKVTLVEALWRKGERVQASEVCQEILDEQPHNLKANLIMGEIWSSSGRRAESRPYLAQAQALDPENRMADKLFGMASPLPEADPHIPPLDDEAEDDEEQPESRTEHGTDEAGDSGEEMLNAKVELPPWLEELTAERAATSSAAEKGKAPAAPSVRDETKRDAPSVASEEEERDAAEHREPDLEETVTPEEMAPGESSKEDSMNRLRELDSEELDSDDSDVRREAEEIPAWLSGLGDLEELKGEDMDLQEEEAAPQEGEERGEIPDWLEGVVPESAQVGETPPVEPETTMAEGETSETVQAGEEPIAAGPGGEETPGEKEMLSELQAIDDPHLWFKTDDLPSAEEALTWLAKLAEEGEEPSQEPQTELAGTEMDTEGEHAVPEEAPIPSEAEEPELEIAEAEEGSTTEEEAPAVPEEEALVSPSTEAVLAAEVGEAAPEDWTEAAREEIAEGEPSEAEAEAIAPQAEEEGPAAGVPSAAVAAEAVGPLEEGESAAKLGAVTDKVPPAGVSEKRTEDELSQFISAQRAYVAQHPDDHEAELELGRVLWQADKRNDATEMYEQLIKEDSLLGDVIADMEDYAEEWSDPRLMQALGDAYRKMDRLQEALDTYRQALARL